MRFRSRPEVARGRIAAATVRGRCQDPRHVARDGTADARLDRRCVIAPPATMLPAPTRSPHPADCRLTTIAPCRPSRRMTLAEPRPGLDDCEPRQLARAGCPQVRPGLSRRHRTTRAGCESTGTRTAPRQAAVPDGRRLSTASGLAFPRRGGLRRGRPRCRRPGAARASTAGVSPSPSSMSAMPMPIGHRLGALRPSAGPPVPPARRRRRGGTRRPARRAASASERGASASRWSDLDRTRQPAQVGIDEDDQRALADVERHLGQQLVARLHLDVIARQARIGRQQLRGHGTRRHHRDAACCRSR